MYENIELLAPAGSFEACVAAIQNGANAVYLGGNQFSARAFATNFSNTEIAEAVTYAHLRNVKVYVTINILYQDSDFQPLYEYLQFLYNTNVDAVIIQDMGVLYIIQKYFPDFEVHISTQASIYNIEGVRYFENKGVSRIVLARENTIEEISQICKNTNLEIEVFVHGALCVSYSGQCLMSSVIGKRSGNKGSCAQPCRLRYTLLKDDKPISDATYILSPKDLCTIDSIGQLLDVGITSFKIEGRMKRPEYVATIVKAYRKAIDNHIQKQNSNYTTDIIAMKKIFNRGFTKGYVFHDAQHMSTDYSGNRGIEIGTVVQYLPKTKKVVIQLSNDLKQHDTIVFKNKDITRTVHKIYVNQKLTNIGKKKQTITLDMQEKVIKGDTVYKVVDSVMLENAKATYQKDTIKTPITIVFSGAINEPCTLQIDIGKQQVVVQSETLVEQASHQPLSIERIEQQLQKLGNSVYACHSIQVTFPPDGTISIKELNTLRRRAIEEMNVKRITKRNKHTSSLLPVLEKTTHQIQGIAIKVQNIEQLEMALNYEYSYVFYPIDATLEQAYILAKSKHKKIIPYTGFMLLDAQLQHFMSSSYYDHFDTVLVGNHGALAVLEQVKKCILDTSFNICNSYASAFYHNHDYICSLEMSKKQVQHLQTKATVIYPVYGYIETMLSKYCPISQHAYNKKVAGCNLCKKGNFTIMDRKKEIFPIQMDSQCFMHLYNSRRLYLDNFQSLHADYILLTFTIESPKEVAIILTDYFDMIRSNKKSQYKTKIMYTNGYY